jgi:hypothetical protein
VVFDPKAKKVSDDFSAARKRLPAKAPDAAKQEYTKLIKAADVLDTQLKAYSDAVEECLGGRAKYDQKKKELDNMKSDINSSAITAEQIKSTFLSNPKAFLDLADAVAKKIGDAPDALIRLQAASSAASGLKPPDKIP